MITKKLGKEIFAWNPNAWNGKGYWFVLGTNGGLGRAASKKEASALKNPDKEPTKSKLPKQNSPNKREIGDKMKESAGQLKKKFEPFKVAKGVTGTKESKPNSSQQTPQSEQKPPKSNVPQAMSGGAVNGVSSGNALINALNLLYELIKNNLDSEKKQKEIQKNFEEEKLAEANKAAKAKEKDVKDIEKAKRKPKAEKVKEEPVKKPAEKVKPEAAKTEAAKAPKAEAVKTPKAEAAKTPSVSKPSATAVKPSAPAAPSVPSAGTLAKVAVGAAAGGAVLGGLSSQFETGGKKNSGAIVGYDSTGGTSYGTYQIASKVGSMDSFLAFAESKGEKDIVSRLKAAGPSNTGSTKGPFVDEWKKIAAEKGKAFEDLQHAFIEDSQYKPAAKTLLKGTGYDVEQQSPAIKDVFFSTVVQHGPGSPKYNNGAYGIFKKAIEDNGGPNADPQKIISSVYDIRATKFSSSTEQVRASVQKRFVQEKSLALNMLNENGTQLAAASAENKDLKSQQKQAQATVIVNNTTNNVKQGDNKTVATGGPINDNPPYQQIT
jgi:hypothetical protein